MPQEVVDSVSDLEKKRQEAINEVIYTERDFVRDMEYLRDVRNCFGGMDATCSCLCIGLDQTASDVRYHP